MEEIWTTYSQELNLSRDQYNQWIGKIDAVMWELGWTQNSDSPELKRYKKTRKNHPHAILVDLKYEKNKAKIEWTHQPNKKYLNRVALMIFGAFLLGSIIGLSAFIFISSFTGFYLFKIIYSLEESIIETGNFENIIHLTLSSGLEKTKKDIE